MMEKAPGAGASSMLSAGQVGPVLGSHTISSPWSRVDHGMGANTPSAPPLGGGGATVEPRAGEITAH